MTGLIIFLHTIVSALLIVIILMQSGRGGGLTEGFGGAESMFGAQTSAVLIKATTILSAVFLVTCLSLAVMSSRQGKSIVPADMQPRTPQATTTVDDILSGEAEAPANPGN